MHAEGEHGEHRKYINIGAQRALAVRMPRELSTKMYERLSSQPRKIHQSLPWLPHI